MLKNGLGVDNFTYTFLNLYHGVIVLTGTQYVEYYLDRGVLGVTKDLQHSVLEYTGDPVGSGSRCKFDSSQCLVVPVIPPTLVSVCRLIQIYYVLKVGVYSRQCGG